MTAQLERGITFTGETLKDLPDNDPSGLSPGEFAEYIHERDVTIGHQRATLAEAALRRLRDAQPPDEEKIRVAEASLGEENRRLEAVQIRAGADPAQYDDNTIERGFHY